MVIVYLHNEATLWDYINKDISDGYHTFIMNTNNEQISIEVEVYNFYDNIMFTKTPVIGDSISDGRMLILKFHKNLTILHGVEIRPQVRKKGMLLFIKGNLKNYGTISMSARGAIAAGQNVYLYRNKDRTYEYVPANGAVGGTRVQSGSSRNVAGNSGSPGTPRSTGGGGSGATTNGSSGGNSSYSGAGGRGTSYSGGCGGGGHSQSSNTATNASAGSSTGGSGGNAATRSASSYSYSAGGGAGNLGGIGKFSSNNSGLGANRPLQNGSEGTGGLLIIYSHAIYNYGLIESNGSDGGYASGGSAGNSGGGGSGGGSINIMYGWYILEGNLIANGGKGGIGGRNGGNGGNGSITVMQITFGYFLVKQHDQLLTYVNNAWRSLDIPLSQQNFVYYGVNNLGALSSFTNKLVQYMDGNESDEGKVFTNHIKITDLNRQMSEMKIIE